MNGAPFVVREYVRWGDVDPEGIIRYDAYTRFMEMAEGDFFRAIGLKYSHVFERYHIGIPRRAMHMEFLSSPVLDEELEVRVYVSHVGTTSLTMNFDFFGTGGVMRAVGHLVIVCVDLAGRKKRPWPPELLERIAPYRVEQAPTSEPR
jgi:YbgC/YbaW family acyl-CoA thioester hydrolase